MLITTKQEDFFENKKIITVSRKDQVYSFLRRAIISCQLPPGETLRKEEFAHQLGVSRTPVSDAINRLADEGLVEIFPQSATRVALLDLAKIETAQFIRISLETAAIKRVIERDTSEIIASLWDNITRQKATVLKGNREQFYQIDQELHDTIFDAADLTGLREIAARERCHIDRARHLFLSDHARLDESVKEHQQIVMAIVDKNQKQAVSVVEKHIGNTGKMLVKLRELHPTLFVD